MKSSSGPFAAIFYVENCYFPRFWFVRGENFSDAYDWFLCEPAVERDLAIGDDEWDDYDRETVHYNDNGVAVDTEDVRAVVLTPGRG